MSITDGDVASRGNPWNSILRAFANTSKDLKFSVVGSETPKERNSLEESST